MNLLPFILINLVITCAAKELEPTMMMMMMKKHDCGHSIQHSVRTSVSVQKKKIFSFFLLSCFNARFFIYFEYKTRTSNVVNTQPHTKHCCYLRCSNTSTNRDLLCGYFQSSLSRRLHCWLITDSTNHKCAMLLNAFLNV